MEDKKQNSIYEIEDRALNSGKTQKFIKRLYKVTSDNKIQEIVWNNNGTTVLIPNKENFRQNAMSLISHTKEYTAFLRSLNHYQFVKLKRVEEEADEYMHPNFKKGYEELLPLIVRNKIVKGASKKNNKESKSPTAVDTLILDQQLRFIQGSMSVTNQNLYTISDEVMELKSKLEKQEKTINGLIDVLSKVFRQGISNESVKPALEGNIGEINDIFDKHAAERRERYKPVIEINDKHKKSAGSGLALNNLQFDRNFDTNDIESKKFGFQSNENLSTANLKNDSFDFTDTKKFQSKNKYMNIIDKDFTNNMELQSKNKYINILDKEKKNVNHFNYSNRSLSPTDFERMNIKSNITEDMFSKKRHKSENLNQNNIEENNNMIEKRNKKEKVKEVKSPEYFSMPVFEKDNKKKDDKDDDIYSSLFF